MKFTSPKLTGPEPAWAPFKGWSVVFDTDPDGDQHDDGGGRSGAVADGVELLHLPAELIAGHNLYSRLSAWSADLPGHLGQPAGYLPLPPSTYHVTVCDGLSDAQLQETSGNARQRIATMLNSLPGAVVDPASLVPHAADALAHLVERAAPPIDLSFEGIETRGHALVVVLEPCHASLPACAKIVEARSTLLSALGTDFGLDLITPWRPHVTLGYWTNRDIAELHQHLVESGSQAILDAAPDSPIRVGRASVHAFDDMATYWRPRKRPGSAQRWV